MVGTFLVVTAGFYRWRLWRREQSATAYSVRAAGAWSLDEDWRHQLGLWAVGLIIGGAGLRLMYGLGWLRFAWPN